MGTGKRSINTGGEFLLKGIGSERVKVRKQERLYEINLTVF